MTNPYTFIVGIAYVAYEDWSSTTQNVHQWVDQKQANHENVYINMSGIKYSNRDIYKYGFIVYEFSAPSVDYELEFKLKFPCVSRSNINNIQA